MWVLSIIVGLVVSATCQWSYEEGPSVLGPANWYQLNSDCGGSNQSPIDVPSYTDSKNFNFPPFERNYVYSTSQIYVISKDGHTVTVTPKFDNDQRASISGGPLEGTYLLDNLHFHWGDDDSYGSEHTVAGNSTALEMHAVHYNEIYPNFTVARNHPDGLAVVSYLFNVKTLVVNRELAKVTMKLAFLQHTEPTNLMPGDKLDLSSLVVPFDENYVTYFGSLTTPPCAESVTWIVYNEVQTVSRSQILNFRHLYESTPSLHNNFRPVQNLNGRIVTYKIKA